jgi:class 3 adenylate cyclase
MIPARVTGEDAGSGEARAQLTSIDVIASAIEPVIPLAAVSSPDGAVTLMLCDIAAAARAEERVGRERWELILRDHLALSRQVIAHHDGQLVRSERDGFLATFNSSHAGLHAAIELQRAFAIDADGEPLALRVGLHSGFVLGDPDQLLGRNVVLASRIAAMAEGGEILVSAAVRQYTQADPTLRFADRGEHHFKGVLGEHAVYALEWS